MPTLTSLRLFVVAAFAVCIFARMRLPVCEHPTVTFGSSAHGSLLRAKFQSSGEIESTHEFEVAELINLPFEEKTVILYKKKKQALSINSNIR